MPNHDPLVCNSCGAFAPPGFSFCGKCGRRLGDPAAGVHPARRYRWAVIAVAIAAVVGAAYLARASEPARAGAPSAPEAVPAVSPPDISRLTPDERFDRLFRRVMQGAGSGDTTVTVLAPMALAAFEMLDSVDADTRYHAALIKLHMGDAAGAAALGDSILARDSSHLLGHVARGMAFRWQRDTARLPGVYAAFRRHAPGELKRGRPEYDEHRTILNEFLQAAENGEEIP